MSKGINMHLKEGGNRGVIYERKDTDLLSIMINFAAILVFCTMLYAFTQWQSTMWKTDIYGRPITYWQDLQRGVSEHPEWLAPNNWGNQYSGSLAWIALISLMSGFTVSHMHFWKRRNYPPLVDVPWLYVVGMIPLMLLCMASVGVGANRIGFGYEQKIPIVINQDGAIIYQKHMPRNGTRYELEISNYVYHAFGAHMPSAFVISAMFVPWDLSSLLGRKKDGKDRLSPRKEWLVWFCVFTSLWLYWEITENVAQKARVPPGPVLGSENPQDDSEMDMLAMELGTFLVFAYYQTTWMICNPQRPVGSSLAFPAAFPGVTKSIDSSMRLFTLLPKTPWGESSGWTKMRMNKRG